MRTADRHEPSNLVSLCGRHHATYHKGSLLIRGTAEALEVIRPDEPVEPVRADTAIARGIAEVSRGTSRLWIVSTWRRRSLAAPPR